MFSHIQMKLLHTNTKMMSTLLYRQYDETPMRLRIGETATLNSDHMQLVLAATPTTQDDKADPNANAPPRDDQADSQALAVSDSVCPPPKRAKIGSNILAQKHSAVVKLFQSKVVVGLLTKNESTGRYSSISIPISTMLNGADSSSGDVLNEVMRLNATIPLWGTMQESATHNFDVVTNDSAESNLRYERYRDAKEAFAHHLRIACKVHKLYGSQGKVFGIVAPTVSGVIAIGLSMKPLGATFNCRDSLQGYLRRSVELVPSSPPHSADERSKQRAAILDLCLGAKDDPSISCVAAQRRCILEYNLTGNWISGPSAFKGRLCEHSSEITFR
jgi:hypothetical protein